MTCMTRMVLTTLSGLAALTLVACNHNEPCTDCDKHARAAPAAAGPAVAEKRLEPWEPVDIAFAGCERGCGMRVAGPSDGVVLQPNAMIGQRTHCPVSGVVFEVTATSPKREFDGRTLYFCCESCATYFSANVAQITALRGLAP